MKLLKQVIQGNSFRQIEEALNTSMHEKESNGVFARECIVKILIISESLEKTDYITEVIFKHMINPGKTNIDSNRDQELYVQFNLLSGLSCEIYTTTLNDVSVADLQRCDYIIYVESDKLDQYKGSAECNIILLENIFSNDIKSQEVINYIVNNKYTPYHPTVYNLLTIGRDLNEAWCMFSNICNRLKFPEINLTTPLDKMYVDKDENGNILCLTRTLLGVPVSFTWVDNKCFKSEYLFGSYYIILIDEMM